MKFRQSASNKSGYKTVASAASSVGSGSRHSDQTLLAAPTAQKQQPRLQVEVTAASNADTIMDLAASSPSRVVYRMEEENSNEDEEVERIVSAVTAGLRKSRSSRAPKAPKSPPKLQPPKERPSTRRRAKQTKPKTIPVPVPVPTPTPKSTPTPKPKDVEVNPIVSDDSESSPEVSRRRRPKGTDHGFTKRMTNDESIATSRNSTVDSTLDSTVDDEDDIDYNHNYIDDESYGNTSYSDSSSSSSSSSEDSYDGRRGIHNERDFESDNSESDDESGSTASLTDEVGDSFETPDKSGSSSFENASSKEPIDDDDAEIDDGEDGDREILQHHSRGGSSSGASTPQGLDIVAKLFEGAREIALDTSSITSSGKTTAVEVARHVADALSQTTALQKLSFCGAWKGQTSKERVVLEILFDGLLENTSVHTLELRDNHCFDRYAGYAFGTLLKTHATGRLQKLEILRCKFVGSGWNSLLLGLQHSSSLKKLSVESCNNLSSDDIDGITSTIQYLNLECLRLCKVGLHAMHMDNVSFLLRAIQKTKTLRVLDLSKNNLGGVPRAILLLSRCLSGDAVGIEKGDEDDNLPINYSHHIEKLILVDCGISEKSAMRTLVKALDSTLAKLDANNNEHPLVLTSLDLSKNKFGNGGAKIVKKLLENNPGITSLGMVGCDVSASHLKTVADQLRYNNSFLKNLGLSSGVSLAILDSVSAVEKVFAGQNASSNKTAHMVMEADDSDHDAANRVGGACGSC
jgi:outer membrane biosynthesis protein TonB/Ran GTPase-activating protein (RanGAP) involved in mRNA processing and transport